MCARIICCIIRHLAKTILINHLFFGLMEYIIHIQYNTVYQSYKQFLCKISPRIELQFSFLCCTLKLSHFKTEDQSRPTFLCAKQNSRNTLFMLIFLKSSRIPMASSKIVVNAPLFKFTIRALHEYYVIFDLLLLFGFLKNENHFF